MSKGGVQTSGVHYTLYCPKCCKPAYSREIYGSKVKYHRFTPKGSVTHVVEISEECSLHENSGAVNGSDDA